MPRIGFSGPIAVPASGEYVSDTGIETVFPRVNQFANGGAVASQSLRLVGFTCKVTSVINGMAFFTGATAAAATPTLIRYGLWLRDTDGLGYTLVASTPNDTTMLAVVENRYPKATSAPYTKLAGREYLAGILVVSAAAMPTMRQAAAPTLPSNYTPWSVAPIRAAALAGQADLPNTFTVASLSGSGLTALCELTP